MKLNLQLLLSGQGVQAVHPFLVVPERKHQLTFIYYLSLHSNCSYKQEGT